jgi:hypothetical protein
MLRGCMSGKGLFSPLLTLPLQYTDRRTECIEERPAQPTSHRRLLEVLGQRPCSDLRLVSLLMARHQHDTLLGPDVFINWPCAQLCRLNTPHRVAPVAAGMSSKSVPLAPLTSCHWGLPLTT